MFPRKSSPSVAANVAPPTVASLDALPRFPSVVPVFTAPGRGRGRCRSSESRSSALEPCCSVTRPGSAASRRISFPKTLPRLPSRSSFRPARPLPGGVARITVGMLPPLDALREHLPPVLPAVLVMSAPDVVAQGFPRELLANVAAQAIFRHPPPQPSNLLCSEAGRRRARRWSAFTRRPGSRRDGGSRGTPACPRRGRVPGIR